MLKNTSIKKRQLLVLFVLSVGFIAAAVVLRSPVTGINTVEAATATVLHFQGNTEDTGPTGGACTGNGAADIVNCNGPFLSENAVLSTGPSARYGPVSPAVNNGAANPARAVLIQTGFGDRPPRNVSADR